MNKKNILKISILYQQIIQIMVAVSVVACQSACSFFGPDYKQPKIDTPKSWAHNSNLAQEQLNLAKSSWWEKFNDATLNKLIIQALENNNNIQMAIGNISIASAQLKQINMAWLPVIAIGGIATAGQGLNINGIPSIAGVPVPSTTDFHFYQGGLVPIYSLNIMKQLSQTDVAKFNLAANKYAKDALRLAVIGQVVGAYFSLLALKEQLVWQKQLIADLTESLRLKEIQYKNGIATLSDIQQSTMQLHNSEINLPSIEDNIVHTANALLVLINKNPGDIITNSKFENIQTNGKIPGNLPSTVLLNRPDILQAQEQLKAANANIRLAYSNYFPTITLTSPLGAFSSQLSSLFNPSGDYWSVAAAINMPILNLGIDQIVKKSKAQYYVAYYNYVQTVKNAFADVDNSLSSVSQIQNKQTIIDKIYAAAKLNSKLDQTNYSLGYISYPESLTSKINVDNTQIIVTQTKLQQLLAIITVYQAMAGGYNYNNTDVVLKFGDKHDS